MITQRYDIVILGAGESGVGAAILARKQGLSCFLTDINPIDEEVKAELKKHVIPFEEGKHSEDLLNATKEVVKSPGIPDNADFVVKAVAAGLPVISEIEFGYRYFGGKIIAITGSNGKTTTTSLIYQILNRNGENVCLGGNIGWSFCRLVADEIYTTAVLEVSSFQLDGIEKFRPDIAVLLNITPDHLDRYDHNFEAYAHSKFRITENQTENDLLILNSEDAALREYKNRRPGKARLEEFDAHSLEGRLNRDNVQIKGPHNWINVTAAYLACSAYGLEHDQIASQIYEFSPIRHRLQLVGEFNDISYINDSKATNVDAVKYALESFDKPVVWIAGGVDKGNDYGILNGTIDRVKALICLGKDNRKLKSFYGGKIGIIEETTSMEQAVQRASALAAPGDVVLLSPACASFDLFKNYEDRGNQFIKYVKQMNR